MFTRKGLTVAFCVFVLEAVLCGLKPSSFNNFSYLGDAFMHGRLWIENPPWVMSSVPYNGHQYIIEPPFPGLLMMPLCFFFHTQANQTLLSALLVAFGGAACFSISEKIGLSDRQSAFVIAVLLFATSYFYSGAHGEVWQLSSVCGLTLTLLVIEEVSGPNRPWLIGIYAMGAALSRYTLLPLVLVYAIFALRTYGWAYVRSYATSVSAGVLFYVLYNLGRWGTPFDLGYRLYETVKVRTDKPMFSIDYLGLQLHSMFLDAPQKSPTFPWLLPDHFGLGIAYSGLVFAAVFFVPRSRYALALGICTVVALVPNLLYYDTGDAQFGFRHELDFAAFLVVLLALTIRAYPWRAIYVVGYANVAWGIAWMISFLEIFDFNRP